MGLARIPRSQSSLPSDAGSLHAPFPFSIPSPFNTFSPFIAFSPFGNAFPFCTACPALLAHKCKWKLRIIESASSIAIGRTSASVLIL